VYLAIYYGTPWIRWDRGPNAPDQAVLVDLEHRRFYMFDIEICEPRRVVLVRFRGQVTEADFTELDKLAAEQRGKSVAFDCIYDMANIENFDLETAFVARGGEGWSLGDDVEVLGARWPTWHARLAQFLMNDPLHALRGQLQAGIDAIPPEQPQQDLFALDALAPTGPAGDA